MTSYTPKQNKRPKPDHDEDTHLDPASDEAKEIKEKGEPDGGGNFA
jgi:hypothetical protein